MKYTINYILFGGATESYSTDTESTNTQSTIPEEYIDLPIAHSIYEFKSSLALVLKGIEQNSKNLKNSVNGAYFKDDETKTKRFKTSNATQHFLLINDRYDTKFNGLFMNPKHVITSIDRLIGGYKSHIRKIFNNIKYHINKCYLACNEDNNNIYVLDSDNEVRKIKNSLLFKKFESYRISILDKNENNIKKFLLDNLSKDEDKQIYIHNYLILLNLEIQINDPISDILRDLSIKYKIHFSRKKLYPYINLQKLKNLDKKDKIKLIELETELNKIKTEDGKSILDINNFLSEMKSQSGSTGNQVGNDFEKLIETDTNLQDKIIISSAKLEKGTYTTYFTYTHGSSDIDMTVVKN
tara:strand:+ start:395 stop:1456 length:1062 start_codon:yes stop_codon:yes gene_type:complete